MLREVPSFYKPFLDLSEATTHVPLIRESCIKALLTPLHIGWRLFCPAFVDASKPLFWLEVLKHKVGFGQY